MERAPKGLRAIYVDGRRLEREARGRGVAVSLAGDARLGQGDSLRPASVVHGSLDCKERKSGAESR